MVFLRDCGFTVPDCIGELKNLGDIWLRGNKIPTLPDSICELSNMGSFFIMDAGIRRLPECFGRVGSARTPGHMHLELEG